MPCHVALAVSRVELADRVGAVGQPQREGGHVELAGGRRPCRRPSSRTVVDRHAARRRAAGRRRAGRGRRRTARCPAETGVWIVNTLSRADRRPGVVERRRRPATSSRARSASRNAEWPSLRCQTAGASPRARIARTPPTPRTSSWWRRISRPRTYRMWVIGRSGSVVLRQVRVEQQDRHPADLGEPDRDGERRGRAARPTTVSGSPFCVLDAAERQAARGRSRGSCAPGGRRHRSTGGSSPCDTAARRR